MTTDHHTAVAALAEAQQRQSLLLLADDRDVQQITEAADHVRRLEREALRANRGQRT